MSNGLFNAPIPITVGIPGQGPVIVGNIQGYSVTSTGGGAGSPTYTYTTQMVTDSTNFTFPSTYSSPTFFVTSGTLVAPGLYVEQKGLIPPESPPENPRPVSLEEAMKNPVIDQLIKSVREAKILLDEVSELTRKKEVLMAHKTIEEALDMLDKIEKGVFE